MTDLSDEPVLVNRETTVEKGLDFTQSAAYIPRLDGSFDPFRFADMEIATEVARVLQSKYRLYEWKVISEISQGYVAFQLPDLMGPTLHAFIRLADFGLMNDKLILDTAGNLLERMRLPRGHCDMELYNEARTRKHTFDFGDVKH
jgi:hypothetical protein